MEKIRFSSLFFKFFYYRRSYTGDGFKLRVCRSNIGLIFRIYWAPYKDSRHIIWFVGFDKTMPLERKIDRMMKNLSPDKRLAISKSLLGIGKKIPTKPTQPTPG